MELVTHIEKDICVIILNGELDASSAILVDKTLDALSVKYYRYILVDFARLEYISAAGIGVFISHLYTLKKKDMSLILFNMKPKIRNVFTVTGIDEFITIVNSEIEARLWCMQKTCN